MSTMSNPTETVEKPHERTKVFSPVDPDSIKEQISACLESSLPDGIKVKVVKTLSMIEKTLHDSALMAHVIGALVTQHGESGVVNVDINSVKSYIDLVKKHGVYPVVNYTEKPHEEGHVVSLEWPTRE
jgi:hydroxymethylpyrimidine/phosphomethylpyrimidine kinase